MAIRKQDVHDNDDDDDQAEKARKRTRITIDVSPEMRRRIKMAALQNDLSVGEYIGRILDEIVPEEAPAKRIQGHPVTREAIEQLRQLREKIMQERQGKPFSEDSTEMLRQEREKRTRQLMGEE